MSEVPFRPRAYVKEGCPFSFKFLVFMAEAGLLDRIEIIRVAPEGPASESTKERLREHLGKSPTFPTVEVEAGRYMMDSDRIIEHFAEHERLQPDEMPVLSFYKQTIFPKLIELHRIKTGRKND